MVDEPNQRSAHVRTTLRGGGVAILPAFVIGGVVFVFVFREAIVPVAVIVGAAVVAGVLGLVEDVRGVSVPVRAVLQFVIGLGVALPLVIVTGNSWAWAGVAAFFVMGYINVANFMDGVNGISGMHGVLAGVMYAVAAILSGLDWAAAIALLMAGAYLAFLPWNLRSPGLFLGDVGSYLLGAGVAALGVCLTLYGVSPLLTLAPVAIYLADTGATLVRRAVRGEPVLRPHRTHVYQRLLDTGMGHVASAALVSLFTVGAFVIALLPQLFGIAPWASLLGMAMLCAVYLVLPRLRGSTLAPVPSLVLDPFPAPVVSTTPADFSPRRWAVLGATGFVGSAVADRLEAEGCDVLRVSSPRVALSSDLASPHAIAALAGENDAVSVLADQLNGIDVVINAAGMASPDAPASDALYGANTLLPAVIRRASSHAGVQRVVHISSAAVQGRRAVLDETTDAAPFSPYSRSKALGERAFLASADDVQAVIVRATSVQGAGRGTTRSFRQIAASSLASVAGDGTQPTVVSSIEGLSDYVVHVGSTVAGIRPIMLQPWEGCSAEEVLRAAGGKAPVKLPRWVCGTALALARGVGRVVPEIAGAGRRLELMWLGQAQIHVPDAYRPVPKSHLIAILQGDSQGQG
ncbi:NAD-dependent epimerase/dehydratase family protein [Microbacterium sp. SSW1-49]|uniref:NAD-dependent epimerase/dehydratase family protein n=1 Tax=Microbacterium croceum TaxID=2851645 RepID=A0ABT0FCW0_9MICO|nr:NAD-dependent epimerase/dehydratase family protein [Microbacterium croceum]MCK2035905.1 NAD-dependent epimerase/dehydratase family protein [Microbacterium croceum]